MHEVIEYLQESGESPFSVWLDALADRKAQAKIDARLTRLRLGLMGDCKPLRDGVWELRVDFGPGYRVYYAQAGKRLILLLCGGDKRKQSADIKRAVEYWENWQRRK